MAFRWFSGSIGGTCVAFAVSVVGANGALAQAPAPTAESPWVKVCQTDASSKKEMCLVTQEIRSQTNQFIASATLRQVTGDTKVSFVAAVPVGMLIQAGIRIQIDDKAPLEVKYGICFPNACFGEVEVPADFIASLKAGNQMVVSALNQAQKPINVPLSLKGFTKIYDGPGFDPAGGAAQQDKLNEALQQAAEAARQRLIQQQ